MNETKCIKCKDSQEQLWMYRKRMYCIGCFLGMEGNQRRNYSKEEIYKGLIKKHGDPIDKLNKRRPIVEEGYLVKADQYNY